MESSGPHILSLAPHAFGTEGFLAYVTNTVLSTWIFVGIIIIL
jgi:hypothetical protein